MLRTHALLPVRAHLFFRNLQGLWVCSDPQCNAAPARTFPCPVGQLHYIPALTCQCGSRVVELLYCEACGEVFLGGYRRPGVNPNEWYLSPDHPDLEASPDMASLDRDYARYAVFWPAPNGVQPATQQWSQDLVQRRWQPAYFLPAEGRVAHGGNPQATPWLSLSCSRRCMDRTETFLIHLRKDLRRVQGVPIRRVARGAIQTGRAGDIGSPVRTQRTGFQKLAQVLSDVLLREVGSENPSGRKLVVFSDSRQDAAKLSAGMRFAHYLDSLRQALAARFGQSRCGRSRFHRAIQWSNTESAAANMQPIPTPPPIPPKQQHCRWRKDRWQTSHPRHFLRLPVNRLLSASNCAPSRGHTRYPSSPWMYRRSSCGKASTQAAIRRMFSGRTRRTVRATGAIFTTGRRA